MKYSTYYHEYLLIPLEHCPNASQDQLKVREAFRRALILLIQRPSGSIESNLLLIDRFRTLCEPTRRIGFQSGFVRFVDLGNFFHSGSSLIERVKTKNEAFLDRLM